MKCPICSSQLLKKSKYVFCPNINCTWIDKKYGNIKDDMEVLLDEMEASLEALKGKEDDN